MGCTSTISINNKFDIFLMLNVQWESVLHNYLQNINKLISMIPFPSANHHILRVCEKWDLASQHDVPLRVPSVGMRLMQCGMRPMQLIWWAPSLSHDILNPIGCFSDHGELWQIGQVQHNVSRETFVNRIIILFISPSFFIF